MSFEVLKITKGAYFRHIHHEILRAFHLYRKTAGNGNGPFPWNFFPEKRNTFKRYIPLFVFAQIIRISLPFAPSHKYHGPLMKYTVPFHWQKISDHQFSIQMEALCDLLLSLFKKEHLIIWCLNAILLQSDNKN